MNLQGLEKFFNDCDLPKNTVELNEAEKIIDCEKFVKNHLQYLKANTGNKTFMPYYDRLIQLKLILERNKEKKQLKLF